MNSPTSSSVGPKPRSKLVRNDGPPSGAFASIVATLPTSVGYSCVLSTNEGSCVEKRVVARALESGYLTAVLNVPWIESLVDEISLTLPFLTSFRKVGLYGIRTRAFGCSVCEVIQKFSASRPTTSAAISQRGFGPVGGTAGFFEPRPSGAGVTFQPGAGGCELPRRGRVGVGRREGSSAMPELSQVRLTCL